MSMKPDVTEIALPEEGWSICVSCFNMEQEYKKALMEEEPELYEKEYGRRQAD